MYNPQWISNGYINIKNPTKRPNSKINYIGPVSKYDFGPFKNIYDKLSNILANYPNDFDGETFKVDEAEPTVFKDIYVSVWNSKYKEINPNLPDRISFVVTTTNPRILWIHYEGDAPGSAHNHIYFKNKRLLVTKVLKVESIEFSEL